VSEDREAQKTTIRDTAVPATAPAVARARFFI